MVEELAHNLGDDVGLRQERRARKVLLDIIVKRSIPTTIAATAGRPFAAAAPTAFSSGSSGSASIALTSASIALTTELRSGTP